MHTNQRCLNRDRMDPSARLFSGRATSETGAALSRFPCLTAEQKVSVGLKSATLSAAQKVRPSANIFGWYTPFIGRLPT